MVSFTSLDPRPYLFYIIKEMGKHDNNLGSLEQIVLLAVMRLGDDAYGVKVRQEIEKRTGRSVSIGAIYATLERLHEKGFVSAYTGEPTAERGGRAKRYFRIEADGRRALQRTQESVRKMSAGLKGLRAS
jgi:PadR family transcriptional regulator PadR